MVAGPFCSPDRPLPGCASRLPVRLVRTLHTFLFSFRSFQTNGRHAPTGGRFTYGFRAEVGRCHACGASSALHFIDQALEFVDVFQAAVYAGEADVGDLVELLEFAHHELADAPRRHFALPQGKELFFDALDHWSTRSVLTGRLRSAR